MDATSATSRTILGVPLLVSPFVAANTLWAVDKSRVWLVRARRERRQGVDRLMAGTVRVRVAHGWAVAHDGEQHGGGTVLDVPGPLAQQWITHGWAVKVRQPAPSKPRRT